jgi:hypothetical protein
LCGSGVLGQVELEGPQRRPPSPAGEVSSDQAQFHVIGCAHEIRERAERQEHRIPRQRGDRVGGARDLTRLGGAFDHFDVAIGAGEPSGHR